MALAFSEANPPPLGWVQQGDAVVAEADGDRLRPGPAVVIGDLEGRTTGCASPPSRAGAVSAPARRTAGAREPCSARRASGAKRTTDTGSALMSSTWPDRNVHGVDLCGQRERRAAVAPARCGTGRTRAAGTVELAPGYRDGAAASTWTTVPVDGDIFDAGYDVCSRLARGPAPSPNAGRSRTTNVFCRSGQPTAAAPIKNRGAGAGPPGPNTPRFHSSLICEIDRGTYLMVACPRSLPMRRGDRGKVGLVLRGPPGDDLSIPFDAVLLVVCINHSTCFSGRSYRKPQRRASCRPARGGRLIGGPPGAGGLDGGVLLVDGLRGRAGCTVCAGTR